MKTLIKAGFTIVETMLFLGVSALLIMGILVSTGSSINVQRYRDSVTSLHSFLQQQYSDVSNVSNGRVFDDLPCESSVKTPIGQSECVILGKFITTLDGKTLSIKNVVGKQKIADETLSSDDIVALRQYNLYTSQVGIDTYDVEWGAFVADKTSNPKSFSMLILRSPSSGVIRTFLNEDKIPTDENHITDLLKSKGGNPPKSLSTPVTLCVNSDGLSIGNNMSVVINANTTGASGIETFGDNSGCK